MSSHPRQDFEHKLRLMSHDSLRDNLKKKICRNDWLEFGPSNNNKVVSKHVKGGQKSIFMSGSFKFSQFDVCWLLHFTRCQER